MVRARHRASKFVLRRGWTWHGGKRAWSQGHRLWLRSLRFEHREDQGVLDDYLLALEQVEARLRALDDQIEQVSREERFAPVVGRLRAFRGIDTLTAMTLIAELHDFMRFDSARGLMAFLGLVPSEHFSGGKEQRGQITKAGNGHVRRLLIEAAWHYRHRPSVASLKKRREGVPAEVVALADKAMTRLHRRGRPGPRSWSPSHASSPALSGRPCAPRPRRPESWISLLTIGGRSRRMKVGTIQRTRVAALRQGGFGFPDSRAKSALPLDGERSCGSALRAIRVYQNDSSSKRPAPSVVFDPRGGPRQRML